MDISIRNDLFLQYEPVIRWTIKRNYALIQALCLDISDVYQDFCIAAMRAIDGFDPRKSDSLKTHLVCRLQYEVKNLKRRYKPYGMTGAQPAGVVFCSIDYQPDTTCRLKIPVEAPYDLVEFHEALDLLTLAERNAVEEKMQGSYQHKKQQRALLTTAAEKLSQYYEKNAALCY